MKQHDLVSHTGSIGWNVWEVIKFWGADLNISFGELLRWNLQICPTFWQHWPQSEQRYLFKWRSRKRWTDSALGWLWQQSPLKVELPAVIHFLLWIYCLFFCRCDTCRHAAPHCHTTYFKFSTTQMIPNFLHLFISLCTVSSSKNFNN